MNLTDLVNRVRIAAITLRDRVCSLCENTLTGDTQDSTRELHGYRLVRQIVHQGKHHVGLTPRPRYTHLPAENVILHL